MTMAVMLAVKATQYLAHGNEFLVALLSRGGGS